MHIDTLRATAVSRRPTTADFSTAARTNAMLVSWEGAVRLQRVATTAEHVRAAEAARHSLGSLLTFGRPPPSPTSSGRQAASLSWHACSWRVHIARASCQLRRQEAHTPLKAIAGQCGRCSVAEPGAPARAGSTGTRRRQSARSTPHFTHGTSARGTRTRENAVGGSQSPVSLQNRTSPSP